MDELKPCPFCGEMLKSCPEVWRHKTTNITKSHLVHYHPKVGCILDLHRFHFYNNVEPCTIESWNRRANDD